MKRTTTESHRRAIINSLNSKPWLYSNRGLNEFIDQHHADYGEEVRALARFVMDVRILNGTY